MDATCRKWSHKLPLKPRRFTWYNSFHVSWVAGVGGQLATSELTQLWVRGRNEPNAKTQP
jgi:hypothetical protein